MAGKIDCIRRKKGRMGQAGRKDRQAETKRRAKQAGNTTVPRKM